MQINPAECNREDGLASNVINQAIKTCSQSGGGVVEISAGTYTCGTLHMQNGVLLELKAGARLVGTDQVEAYDAFISPNRVKHEPQNDRWHRAMILFQDVEDAGIVGPGIIDGADVRDAEGEEKMRGPHTILAGNSRQLVFESFRVESSANYAFLVEYCDNLEFRDLKIHGGWDGIHIRGNRDKDCERITIQACDFQTGDDSIAGRYWRDMLISRCDINSSCNGIRVIGPAKELTVVDCHFRGPGRHPHITQGRTNALAGILLQPGSWDDTQGDLDEVFLTRNSFANLECPLATLLKPGNRSGRIVVDGLTATGIYGNALSFESWAEDPLDQVVLRNVSVDFTSDAVRQSLPPEEAPELGVRDLPAWGLYAKHIRRLWIDNVRMYIDGEDARPLYTSTQVEELLSSHAPPHL